MYNTPSNLKQNCNCTNISDICKIKPDVDGGRWWRAAKMVDQVRGNDRLKQAGNVSVTEEYEVIFDRGKLGVAYMLEMVLV